MKYDQFLEKLRSVKSDFRKIKNREPRTIEEIELFVESRILKPRTSGLKSLKGLGF